MNQPAVIVFSELDVSQITLIDTHALLNQTAVIADTALVGTNSIGLYRVSYSLECTTSDGAAGDITLNINYTDGAGSGSQSSTVLPLTAIGRATGIFVARTADASSVTYATANTGIFGSSQYALYVAVEKLI